MEKLTLYLSIAGILNGAFLAVFLYLLPTGNIKANRILASLILVVSIKISYAINLYSLKLGDYPQFVYYAITMAAYYLIGPLLYLYLKAITSKDFAFKPIHAVFLAPLVAIILFEILPTDNYAVWVEISQIWYFLFLVLSGIRVYDVRNNPDIKLKYADTHWMNATLISATLIWISVNFLIFTEFNRFYLLEIGLIFTVTLYMQAYLAFRKFWNKKASETIDEKKTELTYTNSEEASEIMKRLDEIMISKEAFINPNLNLPTLAQQIETTPHKLSEAINSTRKVNFTAYVNSFRIQKAKELLQSDEYQKFTIASIAYDCGFNTLSTFNLAFKKNTNSTPNEYRSKAMVMA
jgi:AraC-like DNA-binding protein